VSLRSVLVEVLRGLPDAEIARVVRAATDDDLRPLVQVALALGDDDDEAPPPSKRRPKPRAEPKPKTKRAPKESSRGSRPPRGRAADRLLEALKVGPKTTAQIAEECGVSASAVSLWARQLGPKRVHKSRAPGRGGQLVFEALA
jgi:hypothetical protein